MRRFLMTSPTVFTGEAEMLFDQEGRLVRFDVMSTNMKPQLVRAFKDKLPVHVDDLPDSFKNTVTIVETSYEITFEDFYKDYPLHRNRFKAEKVWEKLNKTDQVKAYHSVARYKKYVEKNQGWYNAMIADRYLRDREYETEWNKL